MNIKEAGSVLSDLRQEYIESDSKEDEEIAEALKVAINLIGNVEAVKELMSSRQKGDTYGKNISLYKLK